MQSLSTNAAVGVPLQQNERISVIDTIRGVALLGILLMNIPFMAMPNDYIENYTLQKESSTDVIIYYIVNFFFEGSMRALFGMLFGAGMVLLTSRLEKQLSPTLTPADFYYRRLIWLLIFGLIDAYLLIWVGDVLYAYAVTGLFLFPFRKLPVKTLLLYTTGVFIIITYKETNRQYEMQQMRVNGEKALLLEKQKVKLTEEQEKHKKDWTNFKESHEPAKIKEKADKEIKKAREGYFKIMRNQVRMNQNIQSFVLYVHMFWDTILCFFIGMILFKSGILQGEKSMRFYVAMLLGCYAIGLTISYFILKMHIDTKFDFTQYFSRMPVNLYQLKRILLAGGHLALIQIVYKLGWFKWLLSALAAVGQMAFTNYLMQAIIGNFIFFGYGLRWFGALPRTDIYLVAMGIWVFQIIFSVLWLRKFKFGPFEWAWRSLTYWKRQPMLKSTAA
ncbi:uncharacterized protein LX64_00297 [Chitinophaga skermanii]|uniref:DUF418 domain-containing protein n=1 Tax=Chitinophaga skermanii TaxID=331697 RepID=A0A327R232_9BACT|nr:DUF418 domain-containing protein [Chitinophaga skermanii]RAJ10691.1 uncharacterized protein LX64_00297 [Chitinophaga skermanii]